ncbi:outer membrane beta-barrel protein [Chondrinema litorale]|uniref:outer membrane beta-barrel protein n=1 Tax=Chondrinema litorale TaxID=2994555 RepID=UPI00254301A4|nr:outer membrane beta-barrel protein [Chondrinema litorale]UZR99156.1 outer membrane beta-barrel protein [Chondrinema litorale]
MDDKYSSLNPTAGISFSIASPRIADRFAIQGELNYFKSSFSSSTEVETSANYREYHDTYFQMSTISIPVTLKYTIPKGKRRVHLQSGVTYDFNFDTETQWDRDAWISNDLFTDSQPAFEVRKRQVGFCAGAGILKSFNFFEAGLGLKYSILNRLNEDATFSAVTSRVALTLVIKS